MQVILASFLVNLGPYSYYYIENTYIVGLIHIKWSFDDLNFNLVILSLNKLCLSCIFYSVAWLLGDLGPKKFPINYTFSCGHIYGLNLRGIIPYWAQICSKYIDLVRQCIIYTYTSINVCYFLLSKCIHSYMSPSIHCRTSHVWHWHATGLSENHIDRKNEVLEIFRYSCAESCVESDSVVKEIISTQILSINLSFCKKNIFSTIRLF